MCQGLIVSTAGCQGSSGNEGTKACLVDAVVLEGNIANPILPHAAEAKLAALWTRVLMLPSVEKLVDLYISEHTADWQTCGNMLSSAWVNSGSSTMDACQGWSTCQEKLIMCHLEGVICIVQYSVLYLCPCVIRNDTGNMCLTALSRLQLCLRLQDMRALLVKIALPLLLLVRRHLLLRA